MFGLMGRVLRLDASVYNEIRTGSGMVGQAALVVVLAALAGAIGLILGDVVEGRQFQIASPAAAAIAQLAGWVISTAILWVLARLFGGNGSFSGVLASVGFASTPNILLILSFIPLLGGLISLVAAVLTFINVIFAVRSAMNLTTIRALIVVILPSILFFILALILVATVFAALMAGGEIR